MYCTYGFLGQRACFNNETNRAFAIFGEDLGGVFGTDPNAVEPADAIMKQFLMDAPSMLNDCSKPTIVESTSSAVGSLVSALLVLISLVPAFMV